MSTAALRQLYLGLDLGGTKVAAGLVTPEGQVVSRALAPTLELRADGDPLAGVLELGRKLLAEAQGVQLCGLGVALPGPAERATLRLLSAPTIPELEGVPLGPALEDAFGCGAAGDNDANAAALAESRFGAGAGYSHVAYFTVSTGIGGGFVVDGRVYRGSSGTSAEFGHQCVIPESGPPCDCGASGCLEAVASGRGFERRARQVAERVGETHTRLWRRGRGVITPESVAEAARVGDPLARQLWAETAEYLGLGVSNVINVLDPGVVVLGGGVATGAADLLFDAIRETVTRRCMPQLDRRTPIVPAALGADVGIVGAASLAMEAGLGPARVIT